MSEDIVATKDLKVGDVVVASVDDNDSRKQWRVPWTVVGAPRLNSAGCGVVDLLSTEGTHATGYSTLSGLFYVDRAQSKLDDATVGGLTRAQCLERYTTWQQSDKGGPFKSGKGSWCNRIAHDLTPAQLAVAKEEWSAQLRAKTAASKAEAERRDREQVVCDDDRWEE